MSNRKTRVDLTLDQVKIIRDALEILVKIEPEEEAPVDELYGRFSDLAQVLDDLEPLDPSRLCDVSTGWGEPGCAKPYGHNEHRCRTHALPAMRLCGQTMGALVCGEPICGGKVCHSHG
jgi:hypothetical protein